MQARRFRWLAALLALTFVAAACGGEVNDDEESGEAETTEEPEGTEEPEPEPEPEPEGEEPEGEEPEPEGEEPEPGEPNIYDDPRDGIFDEFQATYDRGDHPFTQVDQVCLPHDPAPDRVDTDPGITADEINVAHVRSRLEDLSGLGFAVPVGDPKDIFEVFIDYINTECGGIRGRTINLGYAEADVLGAEVDQSRNQACLAVTEDFNATIVMNSTGFQGSANLCIVEEQETVFISTQGQTEEFMERGADRLISLSPTLEESLEFMVTDLLAAGALDGKIIGTAAPNTPGQAEAVEAGLVDPLREAGFEVVFDIIDCAGGTICSGGTPESVTNMINAGVDVFFNVLNVVSAPGYIAEMANQGVEQGDIQFYASDFNSQAGELVSGQITNNAAAGELYDGAIIIDFRTTGEYRDPSYEPNPFANTCNELYNERNTIGAVHDWTDLGDSAYGMVGSVCGIVRIMARALYDAGDNPTIADIQEAITMLGPIDNNAMTPASITPGKTQTADVIQTLDFTYLCEQALPFERETGDICVTGRGDFRPAPR